MSPHERLCQRLDLRLPIFQAPMAGVATPALAAAVSNAGGLGGLGLGASSVEQAEQMIRATAALTDRPFNVNVFCHAPAQRDQAREAAWLQHLQPLFARFGGTPPTVLQEIYPSFLSTPSFVTLLLATRPAVVSFHFGLPSDEVLRALQDAGIFLMASATNLAEAEQIQAAGLDAVIAQGIEAGGHRGVFQPGAPDEALPMRTLLARLRPRIALPLVAAGGIMDANAIRTVLDEGAAAAQLGTAFLLCPEAATSAAYRAQLSFGAAVRTSLTPVLSGRPARGLVNALIEHGQAPGSPPPADYPLAYDAAKQLHALASAQGDYGYAAHWAGVNFAHAQAAPAAALMAQFAAGLDA